MYTLPSSITVDNVESVRDELLKWYKEQEQGSVVVDAAKMHSMDATGLQLLIVASNTFGRAGYSFQLVNATPALEELLELSGGSDLVEIER